MVRIFKALMPRFGMLFALLQIGRLLLKAGKLLMTIRKFLPKMRKVSSEKRWLCIYISYQKTVRLNSLKDYPELRFRSCIDNGNPDQRWKGFISVSIVKTCTVRMVTFRSLITTWNSAVASGTLNVQN